MRGPDRAAADVQRRRDDALDAERLERVHGADDVDDRIERADLVEVDLLERGAVNRRLGLAEPGEQLLRAILAGRGSARSRRSAGRSRPASDAPGDASPRAPSRVHVTVAVMMTVIMPVAVVAARDRARGRAAACFAADAELRRAIPARVTRSVQTVAGAIARLPSARRTSSSGTPASISAPRTMSPEAPEKQSKYRTVTTRSSYRSVRLLSRISSAAHRDRRGRMRPDSTSE